MPAYLVTSGGIFALVAIVHAARLLQDWSAVIGGWELPMSISLLALAVATGLSTWALILFTRVSTTPPGPAKSLREDLASTHEALEKLGLGFKTLILLFLILLAIKITSREGLDWIWNIAVDFLKEMGVGEYRRK